MTGMPKISWWKWMALALLAYSLVGGLMMSVPRLPILNETIRNLYFHVPMWFGMVAMLAGSAFYALRYMMGGDQKYDYASVECANTGVVFGILGMLTGMVWAQYTWGEWWSADPKQLGSAAGLMVYFAYLILRGAFNDGMEKARVSAVYNVFAFPIFIALIFVMPRYLPSLHPGGDGNPGFNTYDLDSNMRLIFYPSVIAWILIGAWITALKTELRNTEDFLEEYNTINEVGKQ